MAEVSRFKKCNAPLDPKTRFAQKGDAADPHSFSTLFREFVPLPHPFSIVTTSELFSDHLSSSQFSQLLSTALKVVSSLPTSAHLFSPLPCSSQLFSTTITSAHLVLTLLNSSQRFSPLATPSSHLFSPPLNWLISPLSQLISTLLTFSTLANSSQHFSPPVTEILTRRASFYTEKHLHTASSYTEKLIHTASFTHSKLTQQAFTQGSFYTEKILHRASFFTEQAFAQRSSCTEKLLHKASFYTEKVYTQQAFTQRSFYTEKLLLTASFYTEKALHKASFLHGEAFPHSKLLHREAATQDPPKLKNICCQSTIHNLHAATKFCDLRFSAAKGMKSILHAAAKNLDAAIPLRSAESDLQNAIVYAQRLHKLQLQNRRCPKHHSQLSCCHYIVITTFSCQRQ